jgi:pentatricopeptide repeat protein
MSTLSDEVLDMMQADEIPPNKGTFHALITACASVGDVVSAKVYFDEMKSKYGLQPDADIYNAMLNALGSSQNIGPPNFCGRFFTRGRAWPERPKVDPKGLPAAEKTSRLMWDMMDEEKGKKFKGFQDDIGEDIDDEDDDEEEYDDDMSLEEEEDDEPHQLTSGKDEEAGEGTVSLIDKESSSLVDDREGFGLNWRDFMEREREAAKAIISKGEQKRLSRSKNLDIELVEVLDL